MTPLAGDRLDEEAVPPYVSFLADAGLDGLLALGTTGEGILFGVDERRRAVESFVTASAGRLQVAIHCGAQTTADTVTLAAHAAEAGANAVAVIGPPYFQLDERALLEHFVEAAAACAPLPFYVYEFERASGYSVPLAVITELRERAPNLAGLKVSDAPFDRFSPYLIEGLDVFVGPEALIFHGLGAGAAGAVSGLAAAFPDRVAAVVREPTEAGAVALGELRAAVERFPRHAALKFLLGLRGVPVREDVRRPLRQLTEGEREELRGMGRVVVAGAGAIGASIAYHLALRGADDVVLADVGEIAGGATGKAMGGVRQQFTTEAEVRLAQGSVRLFQVLGAPLFEQVGYLFLATTPAGLAELEDRRAVQAALGVPVESVDASFVDGLRVDDVLGATICREDGIADPAGVTRELVQRAAAMGVEVRERTDALSLEAETLVVACGADSPAVARTRGVELPIRPLVRQLADVGPVENVPSHLPMTIEENGFHFRRVGRDTLRLAMGEPGLRWDGPAEVREDLVDEWRERLAIRYPQAAGAPMRRAWAGFYDMTPDAHPIIGHVADGVYAACGFSGHGFMQSPAVGDAVAAELTGETVPFDLSPYRLDRFEAGAIFPETLVL